MANFCIEKLQVDKTIINFLKSQNDIIIDKHSAKGGNGQLFFGSNKITKKRVALKFYCIDGKDNSHEEVRILSSIKDKNILEVLDAKIISKDYAYFLTPEIVGGDLDKLIQDGRIEINRSISIVKDILKGLTTLHGKNYRLIHRDLKPGNVLIDVNKNAFIADFGSIKVAPPKGNSVKATQHSIIYRPPEAFLNSIFCFQSDIYQVGIILYQLLGGYFPYRDFDWLSEKEKKEYDSIKGNYESTMYFNKVISKKICSGKLLQYNSLSYTVSKRLRSIIKKSTHVVLGKRYQATSEFMRDIHESMKGAVDWCVDTNGITAIRPDHSKFRIVLEKNKYVVYKKSGKDWKKFGRINGTLEEIVDRINKL